MFNIQDQTSGARRQATDRRAPPEVRMQATPFVGRDSELSQKPAAIHRRACRAAKREWHRHRNEQRCAREKEIAVRMTRRWYPEGTPPLIALDYRYWQAMRCGWNAMSPEFRRVNGKLADPYSSTFWHWWAGLHFKTRNQVVEISRVRVVRTCA